MTRQQMIENYLATTGIPSMMEMTVNEWKAIKRRWEINNGIPEDARPPKEIAIALLRAR